MFISFQVSLVSVNMFFIQADMTPKRYPCNLHTRELTTMAYGTARFSALISRVSKWQLQRWEVHLWMEVFATWVTPWKCAKAVKQNLLSGWALTCSEVLPNQNKGVQWKHMNPSGKPESRCCTLIHLQLLILRHSASARRCTLRLKLISNC